MSQCICSLIGMYFSAGNLTKSMNLSQWRLLWGQLGVGHPVFSYLWFPTYTKVLSDNVCKELTSILSLLEYAIANSFSFFKLTKKLSHL